MVNFFKVTGTTALHTVDIQFRSYDAASNGIDKARIVAFKIPDPANADIHYYESLSEALYTAQNDWSNSFSPSSAGDYIWMACGYHHEGPGGASTGGLSLLNPSSTEVHQTAEHYIDGTDDGFVPLFHVEKINLTTGTKTFTMRFQPDLTPGSEVRGRTMLLFRADVFDAVEYASATGLTSTTSTTYQTKATLTTASTSPARDFVYLGVLNKDFTVRDVTLSTFADVRVAGATILEDETAIDRSGYYHDIALGYAENASGNRTIDYRYKAESGQGTEARYVHIISLRYTSPNTAPSAPQTPYCEGAVTPVTGVSDTTPEFSAIYDDADTSDTSANYQAQVATDTTFTDLPSGWWDANYRYRQKLTVSNSGASIAEAGYSVKTTVDTAALETASKVRSDRRDWRVAWQPSDTNRSLQFNGSSNYIDISDSASISPDNITVSAWVYRMSDSGTWECVISKWNDSGVDQRSYDFGINTTDKAHFAISTDGFPGASADGITTIGLNTWYHIVGTYDGSDIKIYVNGVQEGIDSSLSGNIHDGTGDLRIGAKAISSPAYYFNGKVDETRIWNVALTPEQINARRYTRLRGDEPGLVGYWRLDEGSGTVA
ncbi:LamG domain-containing protein, partial [Candidatus Parcubacteria bacterium]|nr:LamG domain-containing protein [Candidatus Parcubacteria bacterium]